MATMDELLRRVEKLEARAEIAELASAYAIACDEHDMPRLSSLFAEDAVFDSPSGFLKANSRQEICDMFVRVFKIRGPGYHWTHDHFVRFDDNKPDEATGLVLSHAETLPGPDVSLSAMRYEDRYRREAGRWVFARRSISFLYYVPAKEFTQVFHSPLRVVLGDKRVAADYPEPLAAWQAFEREHGGKA